MSAAVRTTCPYCGVGCGVLASEGAAVRGDPDNPANLGRLCSKGAALAETLGPEDRLLYPMATGRRVSWDAALDQIARRFSAAIAEHGPDAVAFYVSGQCLTEDYYVANKLMKGFIGSGNIDTNSRLCMASSVAGHVRAFGADIVPGIYEDLEQADLVILVGSNLAWCHPVLYQRLIAARARRGTRIVVIDPRRTASCDAADLHLALAPGGDVALFNGLLAYLADHGALDQAWIADHADGLTAALAAARGLDIAGLTGLDPADIAQFYAWFAATARTVTLFSQGVNQASSGTDKVNAIINCHLATGRIGTPGTGPFSITGQPNAMGGREVGGLANQLAAHMRFEDPADLDRVRRFWRAPRLATRPGLKAVEMFDAVLDGRIKAIWIMATNPADSLPRSDRVRAALAACPFVVVSDCWSTDTTAYADIVLPAAGWGEKDGMVTNSERRLARQRAFRPPPGEARADWAMLAEIGRRMGWADAFAWDSPAAVFREHAALSAFENDGARVFNLGALAGLDDAGYADFAPTRWPLPVGGGEGGRLFAQGGFPTPNGRARFVATPWRGLAAVPDHRYPFLLNTGRIRDQWHTMTRTGRAGRLLSHIGAPQAAVAPEDARRLGLVDGGLVRVESEHGQCLLAVTLDQAQRVGEIFVPMHWTDQFSSAGPIGRVVGAAVDPISGQPALKATSVALHPMATRWRGLLLHRRAVQPMNIDYWARVPVERGHAIELAGTGQPPDAASVERLLAAPDGAERLEFGDAARGIWRYACLIGGRLDACLLLARDGASLPSRDILADLLGQEVDDQQRPALLAGRRGAGLAPGRTICACFSVGLATLGRAIISQGLSSVDEIGRALQAGTGCGSCIPELREILRDARVPA